MVRHRRTFLVRVPLFVLTSFALVGTAVASQVPEAGSALGAPPLDGSARAGQATPSVPAVQAVFGSPQTFATRAQLQRYGFSFGPSDGQFGAIPAGDGSYTFYAAAGSTSACASAPNSNSGSFTFTGTLDHVTGSSCTRVFGRGDGPTGWVFDRDYAGGGQVSPFLAVGTSGWLMPFHAEFQWSNPETSDHKCNGVPCFYSSLGLAISTDAGKTFHVVGQILQPSQPLSVFNGAGANMPVGYGSLILADANGEHLDNPPSDPSNAYFYLFYSDLVPGSLGACARAVCLGVARAPYLDLVAAALGGNPDTVATVFYKYNGASPDPWTQPATSDTPDESGTAGSYAPLWTDTAGSQASVIYDSTLNVYLCAYLTSAGVTLRSSSDLLHWSAPIATYSEPGRSLYSPTILGETGEPTNGGPTPRVYFTSFTSFPNWGSSIFEGVPVSLTEAMDNGSP